MKKIKQILLVCFILHTPFLWGQCIVSSSNGYDVNISITPLSVVAPLSCPFGYNYNIVIAYDINFTGTNIPSSLYTLQGNITCGSSNLFFNLPNTGGTGTSTTTANPYTSNTDCATVTIESLNCNNINIQISGPGISNQTVSCPIISLPIELIGFNIESTKNNEVNINWETASEMNNDYFLIERSNNGLDWEVIEKVRGAGNSSSVSSYISFDENPFIGISYYRLKQTDFNGRYEYSAVRSIKIENVTNSEILIYPNPTSDQVIIEGDMFELEQIRIYNTFGQEVTKQIQIIQNRKEKIGLNLSNLNKGIYFVKSKTVVSRIYKQ